MADIISKEEYEKCRKEHEESNRKILAHLEKLTTAITGDETGDIVGIRTQLELQSQQIKDLNGHVQGVKEDVKTLDTKVSTQIGRVHERIDNVKDEINEKTMVSKKKIVAVILGIIVAGGGMGATAGPIASFCKEVLKGLFFS